MRVINQSHATHKKKNHSHSTIDYAYGYPSVAKFSPKDATQFLYPSAKIGWELRFL